MPITKEKDIDRKKSIGDVAKELEVPTHVIRFWESKFTQIKPEIGKGKRRYYFTKDVETLKKIKSLLYEEGYTINGLQKLLKKRKHEKKEEDLQFLAGEEKSFEIENFVGDEQPQITNLNPQAKTEVSVLLKKIEANLNNLEKLFENLN